MKGLAPLILGIFGTFGFSWLGLILIPNYQIGHLDPQMDEEATDVYPLPRSGMAERGRHVYVANGCAYCHSEQIRPDYIASDIDRERDAAPSPRPKWAVRRSAPRDYIFARPVLLGKERMGPDLANIGKAAPAEEESPAPAAGPAEGGSPSTSSAPPAATNPASASPVPAQSPSPESKTAAAPAPNASPPAPANPAASPAATETKPGEPRAYTVAWHHQHLYAPRSIVLDSNMPAFRFLYEKRPIGGQPAADALQLTGSDAPKEGSEIVPTYDAECLVAYLMSLDQSHPLKEVKSGAPAGAPAAAPGGSPPAPPPAGASPAASPPAPPPPKK